MSDFVDEVHLALVIERVQCLAMIFAVLKHPVLLPHRYSLI